MKVLKSNDINTENVLISELRLGKYFVECGHSIRATNVIYDRKDSAFSSMEISEINIDNVLTNIDILHITGITPALNNKIKEVILNIIKEAKKRNIIISYDSNYRSKLWSKIECAEFLQEVLNYVDVAFLGELDTYSFLGIEIQENDFIKKMSKIYIEIKKLYPNIKIMSSIKRFNHSANTNTLRGYIYIDNKLYYSKDYNFDIIDRVGGGDAFVAGILNTYLKKYTPQDIVEFGTVASVYKHSYKGDINLCDEKMVLNFMKIGVDRINR